MIISSFLPALPVHVRKRYNVPVKELILVGLKRPQECPYSSLIFQSLANRHGSTRLASRSRPSLLLICLKCPKSFSVLQHVALIAIARLLATPQGDAYEMLAFVHATCKRNHYPEPGLKAFAAGICGSLGSVELDVSKLVTK